MQAAAPFAITADLQSAGKSVNGEDIERITHYFKGTDEVCERLFVLLIWNSSLIYKVTSCDLKGAREWIQLFR
jgi:hypothetical protein